MFQEKIFYNLHKQVVGISPPPKFYRKKKKINNIYIDDELPNFRNKDDGFKLNVKQ